tara:strand:- start:2439 stop:3386 length:948 start_codon:yes stop_codon:yes gene_type:complete
MMNFLIVIEDNRGSVHRMSLEAIAGAQKLGGNITALAIGENANSLAQELSTIEIDKTLIVNHDLVSTYTSDGYTEVVSNVIQSINPDVIIAGHSYQTRDFMPRVSARLNIPFIPDVTMVEGDNYTKQILNAKLNCTISSSSEKRILSFQSACFSEEDIQNGTSKSQTIDMDLDSSKVRSISEKPFQESASEVDLESAELIVSVGRGIEKEENTSIAFDLASILNAEVSASRPVVDAGWLPSFRQVGSSGSTISPKLYFSLGVSGAIQHVVGIKGSKNILAINKDPDAPIFEIADYAVVGDVLDIVPKLVEALSDN